MPKKSPVRKKNAPPKAKSVKPRSSSSPGRSTGSDLSDDDYAAYLERYEVYGDERPRLNHSEFNRLDDELLDLLAEAEEGSLNDDQLIRLRELEFLLLDEQSDSSSF